MNNKLKEVLAWTREEKKEAKLGMRAHETDFNPEEYAICQGRHEAFSAMEHQLRKRLGIKI